MAQVILLSLVTASAALALSEATVFAGARDWVKARSVWAGKLADCGCCLGHRVTFEL